MDRSAGPTDDLLAPTLSNASAADPPWRLNSQFFVAFFGGALAIAVISFVNGRRLGLDARRMRWIAVIGALGVVAALAIGTWASLATESEASLRARQTVRLAGRVAAVLAYLGLRYVQAPADRAHAVFGRPYASLWNWGLAAVLGLGTLQNVAIVLLARWLGNG